MSHNLLRRLGQSLLVLWAAFTLSFVLLQVLPGDAVLIKFRIRIWVSVRRKSPICVSPTAPTAQSGRSISTP